MKSYFIILLSVFLFLQTASCDIPKDIHGTLERVKKDKILRVGYSNHPPFVVIKNGDTTGIEYNIVSALAEEMEVKVEFTEGTEAILFEKLEKYELDVVIAGLNSDSPWKSKAGFTNPYGKVFNKDCSIAVPPGENAFIVFVEKFLVKNKDRIKDWIDGKP